MPVYEYRCQQCNKIFEYQQRMADAAKTTCEECAGSLERLISRSSFSFKGGGWYKDLYASAKSSNDGAAETPSTPAPASATAPSTPAPAAASESSSSSTPASTTPAAAGPAK